MKSRTLIRTAIAMLCGGMVVANAQNVDNASGPAVSMQVRVASQPIAAALNEFARQTGLQVVIGSDVAAGVRSTPVEGSFTREAALDELLKHTGLRYEFLDAQTVAVLGKEKPSASLGNETSSFRVARVAVANELGTATRENTAQNTAQDSATIAEVVVTALKREQLITDIPISMSAIGETEIDHRGLVSMGDYMNSVPGVSFVDAGPSTSGIVIRGLAIDPEVEQATVGVYLGETPLTGLGFRNRSADIRMVDIRRVEVLRGPQGTLYGAASMGGTVRNIPNAPDMEKFEGSIRAGYSDTARFGGGNWDTRGVINIPLRDNELAVRAVGYQIENSGYYRNIAGSDSSYLAVANSSGAVALNKRGIGDEEVSGGRIAASWQPGDALSVDLSYLVQNADSRGWPSTDIPTGSYSQRRLQLRTNETGALTGESESADIDIANATVTYDLHWGKLLSSTSRIESTTTRNRDLTANFVTQPWSQANTFDADSLIEELRLTSQLPGRFQFVLGYFYEDRDTVLYNFGFHPGTPSSSRWPNSPEVMLVESTFFNTIKESSFFGELSYQLTDQFSLVVGGRAFSYDRDTRNLSELFGVASPPQTADGEQNDQNYKAGLTYKPNDNTLLYTSWNQGFRLGEPVPANTNPACDRNNDGIFDGSNGVTTGKRQLDSDYVDSYELGGKFTLLDRRLQLDVAAYYNDWQGLPINVAFDFCASALNAGSAQDTRRRTGQPVSVTQQLQINVAASYLDAELTKDAPGLGAKGDRLPGSPKVNASLGLELDFTAAGYPAYVRSDYTYVGGFNNDLRETGFAAGNYRRWNMKAGATAGRYSLDVFVNNLTNADERTWVDVESGGNLRGFQLRPRTIGLNVGYQF